MSKHKGLSLDESGFEDDAAPAYTGQVFRRPCNVCGTSLALGSAEALVPPRAPGIPEDSVVCHVACWERLEVARADAAAGLNWYQIARRRMSHDEIVTMTCGSVIPPHDRAEVEASLVGLMGSGA